MELIDLTNEKPSNVSFLLNEIDNFPVRRLRGSKKKIRPSVFQMQSLPVISLDKLDSTDMQIQKYLEEMDTLAHGRNKRREK